MNKLLENLNDQQKEAVLATEGPVLVLAGAGSGKTKALTHRIAYLVREKKISPYNILAVTFTNKAAKEMTERISRLLGQPINYRLPWMGTFHSICVRILRREADFVGYSRSFSIYDDGDQSSIIKRIMKELNIDPKHFNPNSVQYFISGAKNELIGAEEYKKYINSPFEKITSQVYERYERYLKEANAMDFDDLIMQCVKLFQNNEKILEKYQELFKYILIDEYQDTNQAQYLWTKLLASKNKNIMVVGDDYQCVVPGTKITIDKDYTLLINQIDKGDLVTAASGWGEIHVDEVRKIRRTKYKGYLCRLKTKGGRNLELTPDHKIFANLQIQPCLYYVYLMYRDDKGYRIGITQGVRGKKGKITNGLMVRINQERGDRIWLLESCKTLSDALYFEQFFAFQYGIPTTIFQDSSRRAKYSQEKIDSLYKNIPTRERVIKLASDLDLDLNFPHYQPQAVIKNGKGRKVVNLVMFGEDRAFERRYWHAHRICLNTSDENLRNGLEGMFPIRNGQRGTWRIETSRKNYSEAVDYVDNLLGYNKDLVINQRARLLKKISFALMPAKNLRVGMVLPVFEKGQIIEDEVVSIEKFDYNGELFDLDIENLHNYIANGIIIHNSIYSWRGANFRNILNFERDWKDAKVIKLEQNYRSTKTILEAANDVIKFNENKTDKKLWTNNSQGLPITVYEALNEKDEAEFTAMEIRSMVSRGKCGYSDCAILYRTNAQSRAVEETFLRFKIPYKVIGGVRFYDRKEIKDVLSYLRFIANQRDFEAFARLVTAPPRGIGEKTVEKIREFFNKKHAVNNEMIEEMSQTFPPKVTDFFKLIKEFIDLSATKSLDQLIYAIATKGGIKEFLLDGSAEGEGRWENVEELMTVAEQVEANLKIEPENDGRSPLEVFLEQVALVQDVDQIDTGEGVVTLMTLHSAKGLEFQNVFIVGVEEGLFPHSRALMDASEMEEERRLCYVGITRAKERLYLIHAGERNIYGRFQCNEKSRFIENIPEHLIDQI